MSKYWKKQSFLIKVKARSVYHGTLSHRAARMLKILVGKSLGGGHNLPLPLIEKGQIYLEKNGGFHYIPMALYDAGHRQYGLWSFQAGGTKLERFLHKNQHAQRKLLNF